LYLQLSVYIPCSFPLCSYHVCDIHFRFLLISFHISSSPSFPSRIRSCTSSPQSISALGLASELDISGSDVRSSYARQSHASIHIAKLEVDSGEPSQGSVLVSASIFGVTSNVTVRQQCPLMFAHCVRILTFLARFGTILC